MPDDDIQMAGVPPIVYPPESSASQQVPTPSESYQSSTAQEQHESEIAKVLQIIAGIASRSTTPISNYLSKRLEIEEDTRMLNPKKAVKKFTPEVEFDLAAAKASQKAAYKQQPAP
ncbi:hypothetical protein PTT_14521 [Pyrenophora teres f. teres 0-1]|uniref:Uncharacterized protein n=1 Tax=Pyrenophora teres f. teres (strain 0-1) TaxID=861557 RepID=E3RYC2_PYRTT|nr:hypothetical protein PTT_14521 [Pyrenophora teres f. teres 0-1]